MRRISLLLLLSICSINLTAQTTEDTLDVNKIIIDADSDKPMLIGYTTREAFADTSFSWWYDSEYKNYDVDVDALKPLFEDSTLMQDLSITVVMGSWCSDSRREVPRFLKIVDGLKLPEENINLYSVDRNLSAGVDDINDLDIKLVPTFIFFKNSVELGRIVEMPEESLEIDMVNILTGDTSSKVEEDLGK